MSEKSVCVENLGKRYFIVEAHEREETLAAYMTNRVRQLGQNIGRLFSGHAVNSGTEEIWALKDVSFEVERGEVMGFVGANGAGKSTLLKILSNITAPTTGRATLYGRVGSLLEVGTGFHEELSGRNNIYLSGAILGLSRAEINARFDDIVTFSEIGKYLDTPIKRYSSGMRVRLGFAVAAHLNPEILIVDEVLAVGDASFRKKCLGKMNDVARGGRTVLFVSHNMGQIRRLCDRVIWLENGRMRMIGDATDVSMAYEQEATALRGTGPDGVFVRPEKPEAQVWIRQLTLLGRDGNPRSNFLYQDDLAMDFILECTSEFDACSLSEVGVVWHLTDENDIRISSGASEWMDRSFSPGKGTVRCWLEKLPLYQGSYKLFLELHRFSVGRVDTWRDAATFQIVRCLPDGINHEIDNRSGSVHIPHRWEERGTGEAT